NQVTLRDREETYRLESDKEAKHGFISRKARKHRMVKMSPKTVSASGECTNSSRRRCPSLSTQMIRVHSSRESSSVLVSKLFAWDDLPLGVSLPCCSEDALDNLSKIGLEESSIQTELRVASVGSVQ
ncbi:unnamed protein product, partial [Taenia asiatica]|uniref:MAST3 n=1 Tax=Taenia asiatica TaxID=60517 RepID=A0A0R3VYP0_TAEAS